MQRRNDVLIPGTVVAFSILVTGFFFSLADRFVGLENRLVRLEVGQQQLTELLKRGGGDRK